jgi:hypothetical protein
MKADGEIREGWLIEEFCRPPGKGNLRACNLFAKVDCNSLQHYEAFYNADCLAVREFDSLRLENYLCLALLKKKIIAQPNQTKGRNNFIISYHFCFSKINFGSSSIGNLKIGMVRLVISISLFKFNVCIFRTFVYFSPKYFGELDAFPFLNLVIIRL